MAYAARDDRPADKAARYAEVEAEILAVLKGEPDRTARMATVASMLADAFPAFFWTGFYRVDDASGTLIAVFDVDATVTSAFDVVDAEALERLMARVFG